MSKLTVPMEAELLQRFRLAAVTAGTTMSEVVRLLVTAYVKREQGLSAESSGVEPAGEDGGEPGAAGSAAVSGPAAARAQDAPTGSAREAVTPRASLPVNAPSAFKPDPRPGRK